MAARRSCVFFLVVLVQVAVSKPFLDGFLCDLVCSDEDSSDSSDMLDIFGICADCPGPAATSKPPQSISLKLPASPNGISMNVTDNNGILSFVLDALSMIGGAPATTAPAAAPVTPAPAAAPAGNATAAG